MLAACTIILASDISETATAAITESKHSGSFNLKDWEGDFVPAPAYGSLADWTVDGTGNYVATMTDVAGAIGGNGLASGATGWTVETRVKIDPNNLPSIRGIEFQFADDQLTGHWVLAAIGHDGAGNMTVWETGNLTAVQWTGGAVGDFMTFRVAMEGGNGEVNWYADGELIGNIPGLDADLDRQWMGDMGGLVSNGTLIMDYFRMDTTGAFAPAEIPVPTLTDTWAVDASGDWSTAGNWSNFSVPNSNTAVTGFGDVLTSPQTVTNNASVTLNGMVFGDTNPSTVQQSYTLGGSGSLTLAGTSPQIAVSEGSHQFNSVALNLTSSAEVDIAASSSLDFNNPLNLGGNTLTKGGNGRMGINETVTTGGGSVSVVDGVVDGNGTVDGDLANAGGTVSPGNSPGKLSVTGNYLQTSGTLLIELDGTTAETQYDVLDVTGDLTISGGSLDVELGFTPSAGNAFDILNFGTSDLSGATVNLDTLPLDLAWDSSQLSVNGTLSVVSIVPTLEWNVDALGDWNSAANWTPVIGEGTIPNSNVERAVFGSAITSPHTVTTDAAVTVKEITFENANTYVIAGAGSVNLASDSSLSTVRVLQGDHQFQAVVNLSNATDVDVASSSSLAFNNVLNLAGNTLTKTGPGTMTISNDLNTGGGEVVVAGGVLNGRGTVGGDVTNNGGTLSPGNSPGIIEITGDYSQSAEGSLLMEIGGTDPVNEFDVLHIGGMADLAGELDVVLIDGFQPALGDSFEILDIGSLIGAFDTVSLPALSGGLAWDDTALYGSGRLSVIAVPEPVAGGLLLVIWGGVALIGYRRKGGRACQ